MFQTSKLTNSTPAAILLICATVFWGASFVLTKALGGLQSKLDPRASTWLLAALSLVARFGGGAVLTGLWNSRRLGGTTQLELVEGLGLGIFGGAGILLQMDGVMHTEASTCAFLTQCYCIFIPAFLVWRRREWPGKTLAVACVMVLAGVAVLSNVDWGQFRLGRGEWETLASSALFTAQILWLERPKFLNNDSRRMTVVMFAVTALLLTPVVAVNTSGWRQCIALYRPAAALGIIAFLILGSTVVAYSIMNEWQPHVPATEAGLIYCCEPLFTAIFAVFLPGCLSAWAGVAYANERLTWRLAAGGGLITAANLVVLLRKRA